jgi:hypothetical protein
MFKKVLVSVALGSLLLFSLSLWAKDNHKPVLVAELQVNNQLSISAHQSGEESFVQQVSATKIKVDNQKQQKNLPMSVISAFWIMAFALLFFVIRVTTRRIK